MATGGADMTDHPHATPHQSRPIINRQPETAPPTAKPATPQSTATPTPAEETPPMPSNAELTARLKALAARADSGDPEALFLLRDALDQLPQLAAYIGNLAKYSEAQWIELLAPQDLLLRESI